MLTFDRDLLVAYLRPEWRRAALVAILLLAGIGLQLANPEIVNLFITRAQGGATDANLVEIAGLLLVVVLVAQAMSVVESALTEDLAWRTTNSLRADLTRHVLELDGSIHARYGAGELIERIDGDVAAIADFFGRFVIQILGNMLFLLGVLVLLFVTDWRVGAIMAASSIAAAIYLARGGGFVSRRARASRQAAAELSGFIEERYEGLPDLAANGAKSHTMSGLQSRLQTRFRTAWAASRAATLMNSVVGVIFAVGMGGALFLAVALQHSGVVTLGSIYVIFRFSGMLQEPLEKLSQQVSGLQQAAGGAVRVRELLSTQSRVQSGPGARLESGPAAVAFNHVSFDYGESPVLHDVSFALVPGETLGLLGRTGSGKTTISRLLFRLHDPVSGSILVDGVDTRTFKVEDLRRRVGLVTQDVQLFQGTLVDNVRLFDNSVRAEEVEDAFDRLGLQSWLSHLPNGRDTEIGSGGSGLSAGEAQLVALARLFIRNPGVVVLDEASSRVDPATAELIQAGIDHVLAGRTGIIIAHRLETVERVDTVLILEDGAVVEYGARAALEADPGSRLARLRAAGMAEVLA